MRVFHGLTAYQSIENDPHTVLAKGFNRRRGHVIDAPEVNAAMAHKAHFHRLKLENWVPLPEAVIVDRDGLGAFQITG